MKRHSLSLIFFAFVTAIPEVAADVRMPAIFGDHMVLQRGSTIPIWGSAEPGEEVKVRFAGKEAGMRAGKDGKWRVELTLSKEQEEGQELRVSGHNELVFRDVLIGDVWLCSGQSNMAFYLREIDGADAVIKQADHRAIRFFSVGKKIAFEPEGDVKGKWVVCTPETAGDFSAVGYFFGRELLETQRVPVGLIGSYWGGTPAEAWTSLEALQADKKLAHYAEKFIETTANREELRRAYKEEVLPEWEAQVAKWRREVEQPYLERLKTWEQEARVASAEGRQPPLKPVIASKEPRKPRSVDGEPRTPSVLFNGMISGLVSYGIKGAIWYQGEGNANDRASSELYQTLFPAMIADWRERWNQGPFPFLYVQLAGFGRGRFFPELREAQRKSLSTMNVAMASAIDIGDRADIHPKNKRDVGHRLALAARRFVYDENVLPSGPLYRSKSIEGDAIRLRFDWAESGFATGDFSRATTDLNQPVKGFEIAGEDGKYVPATAKIDGNTILVSTERIPHPVRVRYAWSPFPEVNLYNQEGLPVVPFETE